MPAPHIAGYEYTSMSAWAMMRQLIVRLWEIAGISAYSVLNACIVPAESERPMVASD
jgi:hypothetical protein